MARKVVLAVIDGLAPDTLERALDEGRLPALSYLRERGEYARGTTTFPSVTPVCLTTIATGAHPDGHHVPHLVWYHRGERRLVEYGSSFAAVRAVGARRALRDSIVEMTSSHTSALATTVFEAVQDAGLVAGAVNFTAYRGRTRHDVRLPATARRNRWYESVLGPQRFFFFNLYESDATGAGLAVRSRAAGSVDAYAESVGRWLVTRDGFDFLVYYLPDFDYASHASGPDGATAALERADGCIAGLASAAGGFDGFLDRYAIVVCADHGQTRVEHEAMLEEPYADLRLHPGRRRAGQDDSELVVAASNRAGMLFRLDGLRLDDRALAQRLDGRAWAEVVLFREDGRAVARRAGEELRFAPGEGGGWQLEGDADVLDPERYPNGLERAWRALACPNAGEVIVSASEGWEFRDLGGRHHLGGGSHGSLLAGDSLVPILAVGLASPLPTEPQTADLAPLVLAHLGVVPPGSMRARTPVRA